MVLSPSSFLFLSLSLLAPVVVKADSVSEGFEDEVRATTKEVNKKLGQLYDLIMDIEKRGFGGAWIIYFLLT